jgi:hypothetical protein
MTDKLSTHLPELDPAQELLLRRRFAREGGYDLGEDGRTLVPIKATAPVAADLEVAATEPPVEQDTSSDHVYTNISQSILVVSDLGVQLPDRTFDSETFKPGECKDLRELYRPSEIGKSRMLRRFLNQKPPMLVKGRATAEEIAKSLSPLARAIRAHGEGTPGTITDPEAPPLRGVKEGQPMNEFDKKLGELIEKEKAEDEETRQVPA